MKKINTRCLLLNADFTPLSIIHWKKAVVWSIKYANNINYGIDIVDFYKDDFIMGTHHKKYPIPAVANTKRFFKINKHQLIFSRKNIFLRDNHTCQYCGKKYDFRHLTYDHVIPKSKWFSELSSATTWTNIVTCCFTCNNKKGNRSPSEANMPLIKLPTKPNKSPKYLPIAHYLRSIIHTIPCEWTPYLPDSYI